MALSRDFFPGTTRMHEWMRAFDWEKSAFGPPEHWPKSLRTMANLTLDSALPMCLLWGPDLRLIYNDAFLPVMGQQHPECFGTPMREVCARTWTAIEPIVRRAMSGEPAEYDNLQRQILRNGRMSRSWFSFTYTPVHGDDGTVQGVICIGTETTERVLMERRQAFELLVSDQLRSLTDADEITALACRLLGQHLEAARVVYLQVDTASGIAAVRRDWTRGELPSLAGQTRPISGFGRPLAQLQGGCIVKVTDSAQEEPGAAVTCSREHEEGRSMLAVPLFRKGVLAAVIRVEDIEARDWTDDDAALVGDMAERTWTAVEAAEAEQRRRLMDRALHGSAARQAFQLELSDLLQPLEDPEAIIAAASAVLGRHVGAARVLFAEVDEQTGTFAVRSDWTNQNVPSVGGRMSRIEDFGPEFAAALRTGQTIAVDDVTLDERTAPYADSYAKVGVRSMLSLPLVTSGRLNIVLNLQQTQPYHWREVDLQRARDMAERTWAHVETARAQAALRKERDQSRYVFDTMNEGFAMLDPDCRVVQMNAEGQRIARLTASEVMGRRVCDVWPDVEASDLGKLYREVTQSGRAASLEYRRELPDHQVSWVEVRAFPALNGGMAVFYRDINKRKLAEEKLKQADRRKDEFVAMLAHELRNPLAPIAAAAEILSIPGLAPSDVKHTSEVISRQVNHMKGLVNDLLDISRVTSGLVSLNRTELDVNRIVPEAVEQVEPLIHGRGHQLSMHLASSPAMVSGDRKRLVQVLANLLNNAAKYTPPGGKIELRVEPGSEHVALKVRDNGIGMSPQLLASAFELFAQAERTPDRAEGGLGIGLALVKGIVELHGGTVSARSEGLGHGSEFEVLLPRADRRRARSEISPVSTPLRVGAQPLKVLIVDDNVDAARMLAMLLKVAGHLVFVENLSQNALQLATTLRPDVCLLDIALPDMDGNELARRLRSAPETSGAVLVALTGYSQDAEEKTSVSPEFDHHMVKPIETGRLLSLLRQIGAN